MIKTDNASITHTFTAKHTISFMVFGTPVSKGSSRAFVPKGWTRPIVTAANTNTKVWQTLVAHVAQQYAPEGGPWTGAVGISLDFTLRKPKSAKNRQYPITKPDLDKAIRAVWDGLKGIIYTDDKLICYIGPTTKRYGPVPGVKITVWELE